MIEDDLSSVFFDTDDFATALQKVVDGLPVLPGFAGIMAEADEEALQGFVVGTVRQLHYPTAAATLEEGDLLTDGTTTWRVLRPGRVLLDGAESGCYLIPA
jgi:hypothetical protein